MTAEVAARPHLTEEEIDEICHPLTQRSAQTRYLCTLLGVHSLPRRPDGMPLVGRKMFDERVNQSRRGAASAGFNWSK